MAIDLEIGLKATVTVPGSSANLGPGFDTLGLAVGIYDTVEVEVTESGLEVEIFGEGAADLPRDNSHLVVKAIRSGLKAADAEAPGLRVVCNNTLTIALDGTSRAIKVPHNTRFDPKAVKKQLGIAVSQWDDFMYRMRHLAERKVQWHEALGFFMNVMCETSPTGALPEQLPNERALRKVQELYEGRGRGSQLDSARGTAWGLLNAVTEYVDHERRARSTEYRLDSAWFGQGAQIKQRALDAALQLAA